MQTKIRFFGLILALASSALVYYNWNQLNTEGKYSLKLAALGPLCFIGGIFIMLFPTRVGKPNATSDKIVVMVVFVVGLIAGLVNWYLMDPGFFGQ